MLFIFFLLLLLLNKSLQFSTGSNLFVKWRVRYIENLYITNLRGNDQNVRYIEVKVNDKFVTQVTSVEILYSQCL